MSLHRPDRRLPPGGLLLLAALATPAKARAESIIQWNRDPVRIRPTPTAPTEQVARGSLPNPAPVTDRTRDGLLQFKDKNGQAKFVSAGDVKTDAPPPAQTGESCVRAPQEQKNTFGSQGFGARRC